MSALPFRSAIGAILIVALPLHLSNCSQVKQVPMDQIGSGKKDYKNGVRRFVTKWYVNGAVVERIIQAPDR